MWHFILITLKQFFEIIYLVFFLNLLSTNVKKKRWDGVIANCVLACSNTCNGILSTMKRSNVGQHAQGQRKKPVLFKYLKKKQKREIFYFDKQNSSPTAGCK